MVQYVQQWSNSCCKGRVKQTIRKKETEENGTIVKKESKEEINKERLK
jgi:hypothetical protein